MADDVVGVDRAARRSPQQRPRREERGAVGAGEAHCHAERGPAAGSGASTIHCSHDVGNRTIELTRFHGETEREQERIEARKRVKKHTVRDRSEKDIVLITHMLSLIVTLVYYY